MMSQHSNSLTTATAAILVHNGNLLRPCTKMAAVSMAKGCMQTLYSNENTFLACDSTGRMVYGDDLETPIVNITSHHDNTLTN